MMVGCVYSTLPVIEIDMSPTPSTLEFAASLGARMRAVVKRAKARHSFFLVTARRAVKCISWLAGVDAGKQTELRKKKSGGRFVLQMVEVDAVIRVGGHFGDLVGITSARGRPGVIEINVIISDAQIA